MPNWCVNTLTITGPAKDIAAFKAKAKIDKVEFSFEPFLPFPKELNDLHTGNIMIDGVQYGRWVTINGRDVGLTQENLEALQQRVGYKDWHARNSAVLGTKWDVDGHLVDSSKEALIYTFDSAWSPPIDGVTKVSEQYPKLEFLLSYDEPGADFAGDYTVKNGEELSHDQSASKLAQEPEEG